MLSDLFPHLVFRLVELAEFENGRCGLGKSGPHVRDKVNGIVGFSNTNENALSVFAQDSTWRNRRHESFPIRPDATWRFQMHEVNRRCWTAAHVNAETATNHAGRA